MEPIRPDEDDLRNRNVSKSEPKAEKKNAPKPKAGSSSGSGSKRDGAKPAADRPPVGRPSGGRGVGLLSIVLIGLIALGGFLWFEQERRIAALEGQLEEADYWARQSKLALARFEGTLNQTGESLEATGASMAERLDGHGGRLDAVDGEIRKLWALANDRNKPLLERHQALITSLQSGVGEQSELLSTLESKVEAQAERMASNVSALDDRIERGNEQLTARLDEVSEVLAGVDGQVESRLQRFAQERRLADEEVKSRLSALERQVSGQAGSGELDQVKARMAELEQALKSVDASRSQLTSRLVRLSEEVSLLRQQTQTP